MQRLVTSFKYVHLFGFCAVIGGASCAQIVAPQGGTRDTTPPVIISTNFQDSMTQFALQELTLEFDEVVEVADKKSAVELSPLPNEDLEVKSVHKTVTIKIPSQALQSNTTYNLTIKGIQDVTEQNKIDAKSFVFSTGAYLDSLEISGRVVRAEDNKPDDLVSLYLYDSQDSFGIIRKKKPKFYTSASSNGTFTLRSLPTGNYRLYAISDLNQNFLYDLGAERIAIDTHIYSLSDTGDISKVLLFSWSDELDETETESSSFSRGSRRGGSSTRGKTDEPTEGLSFIIDTNSTEPQQDIYTPMIIRTAFPISTWDASLISLTDTTAKQVLELDIQLDTTQKEIKLQPKSGWISDHAYRLFLKDGAIIDSTSKRNDRVACYFRTFDAEDYSTLLFHFVPLDSTAQYVVEWLIDEDEYPFVLNPNNGYDMYSPHIMGENVKLKYFLDRNANGKIDLGDFDTRRQPEIVQYSGSEYRIKKGWDHIYHFDAIAPGETNTRSRSAVPGEASEEDNMDNEVSE